MSQEYYGGEAEFYIITLGLCNDTDHPATKTQGPFGYKRAKYIYDLEYQKNWNVILVKDVTGH